jgi:ABC-type polysaccharide/polyol phosphate export permease
VALAVLFGALFHQPIEQSLPYVMGGLIAFTMVGYVFYDGAELFMASGGVIKNHAYPYTFYVFLSVCRSFFLFLHNLVVYWIVMAIVQVMAISHGPTTVQALTLPHWSILLALPLSLVFMFAWGTLTAMMASRFRDMRFLLPYLGQLFSYLTPIFWHADNLQGVLRTVISLSPMYDLVEIIREPLLGKPADILAWELALAYTGVGVVLWFVFFSMFRRRIAFWV